MMWLIVALALERASLMLTAHSYRSRFTAGYGSLATTSNREALAPIAYRVLVPWIVMGMEALFPRLKGHRLPALYEPLRIGLIALALTVAEQAIGTRGALIVAALLPATFLFDYWDWTVELLALAAALTGNMQLTILCAGLLGLARPMTTPLVGITYGLVTHDPIGTALALIAGQLAVSAVRVYVGKRPMDYPWRMWRTNLQDVLNLFCNRPFYLSEIFLSMGLSLWVLLTVATGKAGAAWPVPLALTAAQWIMPRAAETRSMAACLLWVAMGV